MKVYYQVKNDGLPVNSNIFSAFEGFNSLGYETIPYKSATLLEDNNVEDVVVGNINSVRIALNKFGITAPTIDYPLSLEEELDRDIWVGQFRDIYIENFPVFIKPKEHKLFEGTLINSKEDITYKLPNYSLDTPVYFSCPLKFISEYRVYVLNGEVLGCHYYKGDWSKFPNPKFIQHCIKKYKDAPVAYALDVGVREADGEYDDDEYATSLVEVNAGYSLGNYGMNNETYAHFTAECWKDIIK